MPNPEKKTTFEPTISWPDGDMVLRSSDGVHFRVHSLMLRLALTVLVDMLSTYDGQKTSQIVGTSEDAPTLDTIIQWVYSSRAIDSLNEAIALFPIVTKYQIKYGMASTRSTLLSLAIASSSPQHLFAFAVANRLGDVARAAARQIVVQDIKVLEVDPGPEFGRISLATTRNRDRQPDSGVSSLSLFRG